VGAKVWKTIQELGGKMPDELPVVDSIKSLENKQRRQLGMADTPSEKKGE